MASIVVIDDEIDLREMLADILASQNHQVFQAASGQEGLELIRRLRPELVFLDLMMPGMDGFRVLELIRQEAELRALPVIVLTGINEQIVEGLGKGANDYIIKPFNVRELLARTEVQLRIRRLEKEVASSEFRYRTLFERSADPMVLMDESGLIVRSNEAAAAPWGEMSAAVSTFVLIMTFSVYMSAIFSALVLTPAFQYSVSAKSTRSVGLRLGRTW